MIPCLNCNNWAPTHYPKKHIMNKNGWTSEGSGWRCPVCSLHACPWFEDGFWCNNEEQVSADGCCGIFSCPIYAEQLDGQQEVCYLKAIEYNEGE